MRKFHLVDFAAHYQKGFRNHIVSIADVPALVKSFDYYGCYATYFFYSDEVFTYMGAQEKQSVPTIAGYEGRVWAPFLPIDLDHPDLSLALEAARQLSAFLIERWRMASPAMQIYFSGAKGFHILLDSRLFGKITPSRALPQLFDAMRRHLAPELPENLRETVDLTIKDRVRLLRLPNTLHEKSKLYKIILSLDELHRLGADQIRECARSQQPLVLTDETGFVSQVEVEMNPIAARLFERVKRQLKRMTRKPFSYRFRRPPDLGRITFPCAALQTIWDSHIEPGSRNNCAIRLASELRLLGLNEDEANEKMLNWNEKNHIELPADELASVVHSAYQHRFPYRYSCRDDILKNFCPLRDYEKCRRFVASHAEARDLTKRSS
jgi:primase-like protein